MGRTAESGKFLGFPLTVPMAFHGSELALA